MARKHIYPPSVKPGIPQIGQKPTGWQETTFGDVLQSVQRKVHMQDDVEYQLVTAKRSRGGIVPRETLKGKDILTKTQFSVKDGDFLISRRQIIHGACGIVPPSLEDAIVSNEYATLRPKDGLLLNFLEHLSHSLYFQQTCFHASVGVDVEKMIFDLDAWLKYKVYLPQLEEQQRIAEILSTWDRAIDLTAQLIAAKQQRKRGLMQELLTGKRRFAEFETKQVQNDQEYPQDWQVREFANFVTLESKKFDPRRQDQPARCIELEHLSQETGRIIGYTMTEPQQSIKNVFKTGQVVFGKLRPYLRKYAQPPFDGVCSSEIWVLAGKPETCTNNFLFYLVQSDPFIRVASASAGSKMPRSDWELVSEAVFALPPIEEQRRIAAVLAACDREIEMLQGKRNLLRQQKQGLMQQLLTGQRRVS